MRSNSFFLGILLIRIIILIFIFVSSVLILVGPGLCYQDTFFGYNYDCINFTVDAWRWVNNFVYFQIPIILLPFCMGAISLVVIASTKCCDCHLSRMGHLIIAGTGIVVYLIAGILETVIYFNIPDDYDYYDTLNWFNTSSNNYVRGYLASAVFLFLSAILSMVDTALVGARKVYFEEHWH
ncbi:Hypothetical protein SRAE_1000041300 [Strongyloides ratti]|uniref:Uncharacterized protein n=1 Tax=Strongyloides ratti TaxID=34506 RepID=A0A090L3U5_STRRB|nr:Hypothetical protein SRAE_1000041300 [Strongyloides ratti]CEF62139.1 Hypothetical protein SRAE_1000041300 [Strongyloides ratti]